MVSHLQTPSRPVRVDWNLSALADTRQVNGTTKDTDPGESHIQWVFSGHIQSQSDSGASVTLPLRWGAALLLPVQLRRTLVTAARRGRSSSHYRCRETGSAKVFTHASTCTRRLVQTPLCFKYRQASLTHASQSHVSPTPQPGCVPQELLQKAEVSLWANDTGSGVWFPHFP